VDASFGAVFIIITLYFIDEPLKVLKEASRVLNDKGSVILGLIQKEVHRQAPTRRGAK
jgi:ubiquinone/menaquinone biosynthesis C-methylase UbiE